VTLYELFETQVAAAPDALAIAYADQRIPYGAMAVEVNRVARGLQDRGVSPGDRVLMFAGNSPSVLVAYLAVTKLGAIFVPVNTSFREREGRYILSNAEPTVAIVESRVLSEFNRWTADTAVDLVILRSDEDQPALPAGAAWFDELGHGSSTAAVRPVPAEAGVLLCYTSGTTSTPKPVLHSHRSETYNARTYAAVWKLGPNDRGVVSLPLSWVYGLSTTSMALLTSGGTVVLLERFQPLPVLDAIESHRATAMWGTMSMYTKLLQVLRQRIMDLSSLRIVVNGGEPCPAPAVQAFEHWTGVRLIGAYSTSEVRPVLVQRPGDTSAPEGTVGQVVPGATILLEDANGNETPIGQPGHALLRCPGMLTEYYREAELSAASLTPSGWFKTGDILTRDANGYYFVVGRQSDMIIRSGLNIAPAEVEAALLDHPDVEAAAVVGVPDPRSGEAVRAYLVVRPNSIASAEAIREAVAGKLSRYKVPQEVVLLDELPRTTTGKVNRSALRQLGEQTAPVPR
jgi:long-chain acyl-CoA synthetase